MACYYLVISSTHLSNGHLRNIKGVFRGPLCESAGGDSPDYAEKGKAIAKALEDLKANFYCELCDKQYQKHQEFDNHINSYDHAHKQRLKELKQREFARNVASKSWKDERKQERALRRLHQLAELRQQSERGPGKSKTQLHEERLLAGRDLRLGSRHLLPISGGTSAVVTTRYPLVQKEQLHGRRKPSQTARDHGSRRAGVSFCFSRKAQLKLESSAAVFNDGVEEAPRDRTVIWRQRQDSEAFWSRMAPHGVLASETAGGRMHRGLIGEKALWDGEEEGYDISRGPTANEDDTSPRISSISPQRPRTKQSDQKPKDSDRRLCVELTADAVEVGGSPSRRTGRIIREPLMPRESTEEAVRDSNSARAEDSKSETGCDLGQRCILLDADLNEKQVLFVNVLGKDGDTTLKWPKEHVRYTKSEPYISYSCNPVYFDLNHTRNKTKLSKSTAKADPGHTDGTCKNRRGAGRAFQSLSISKPKSKKHHRVFKTLSSDVDGKPSALCMQNTNSQEALEVESSERASVRRPRLGKRKRHLKEATSNQSDTAARSPKAFTRSLSAAPIERETRQTPAAAVRSLVGGPSPRSAHSSAGRKRFKLRSGLSTTEPGTARVTDASDLCSDDEGLPYKVGKCPSSSGSSPGSSLKRTSDGRPGDSCESDAGSVHKSRRCPVAELDQGGIQRWGKRQRSSSTGSSTDISELSWGSLRHPQGRHDTQMRAFKFDESWPMRFKSFSRVQPRFIKLASVVRKISHRSHSPSANGNNHGPPPNSSHAERLEDRRPEDKDLVRKKLNNGMLLPLIGKLPAVRRRARKERCKLSQASVVTWGKQDQPGATQPDGRLKACEDGQGQSSRDCSEGSVCSKFPVQMERTAVSRSSDMCLGQQPEASGPVKSFSPPLAEQPITFSADEIDKYKQLQLQAQWHVQQQHAKAVPEVPPEPPTAALVPTFHQLPHPQPMPVAGFAHTLLPHRTLTAFATSLAPHTNLQPLAPLTPLHPLPQPRLAPIQLPAVTPNLFPAHPATLLAGPPLHLVPAAAFRPTHLTLHPMPAGSLIPALLAPSPLAPAGPALHLHPLLQPLFPGQSLQPHSGPTT